MKAREFVLSSISAPALLAFAMLAMAPGKCQPAPLPVEPLCDSAKDCEGQTHDDCVGQWTCTDDATCAWECDTEPPPDPCGGTCGDGAACECTSACNGGACAESCGCVPLPMCWADEDCKPGSTCVCSSGCGPIGGGPTPAPVPCLMNCWCEPAAPECVADIDCGKGCSCVGGACVCEPPPPTDVCYIDADCGKGCTCVTDYTKCIMIQCMGTCQCDEPPPPVTGDCMSDSDCAAGQACSGECLPCASCPMCAVCCGMCEDTAPPTTCQVSGCSGQICAAEAMATTCEWKAEYACYGLTKCGSFGPNGGCGWAQTPEFLSCMKNGGMP